MSTATAQSVADRPVVYEGMSTPWGRAQQAETICEGIGTVSTAGHGGIKLSRARNALVPEYMRREGGWYEEDCEWSIPFCVFEDEIAASGDESAVKAIDKVQHRSTLRGCMPDEYEQFYSVVLGPGESHTKDKRLWLERNANSMIVVAAWGDWHEKVPEGMVGVVASVGEVRGPTKVESYWLVPAAEYQARLNGGSEYGFVIDPARHQPWSGPNGQLT